MYGAEGVTRVWWGLWVGWWGRVFCIYTAKYEKLVPYVARMSRALSNKHRTNTKHLMTFGTFTVWCKTSYYIQ